MPLPAHARGACRKGPPSRVDVCSGMHASGVASPYPARAHARRASSKQSLRPALDARHPPACTVCSLLQACTQAGATRTAGPRTAAPPLCLSLPAMPAAAARCLLPSLASSTSSRRMGSLREARPPWAGRRKRKGGGAGGGGRGRAGRGSSEDVPKGSPGPGGEAAKGGVDKQQEVCLCVFVCLCARVRVCMCARVHTVCVCEGCTAALSRISRSKRPAQGAARPCCKRTHSRPAPFSPRPSAPCAPLAWAASSVCP